MNWRGFVGKALLGSAGLPAWKQVLIHAWAAIGLLGSAEASPRLFPLSLPSKEWG